MREVHGAGRSVSGGRAPSRRRDAGMLSSGGVLRAPAWARIGGRRIGPAKPASACRAARRGRGSAALNAHKRDADL